LVSNQIDARAGEMLPDGGYLVSVDENRQVLAGAGAGVPTGSIVDISDGEPYLCHAAGRALPCAQRLLADGSQVIAAVPAPPLDGEMVVAFALVGLFLALGAVGLARLVVAGSTRDLDRVVAVL